MAKKRRVKRARRATRRHISRKSSRPIKTRVGLVVKNLIVFLALALVSYILSLLLGNAVLKNLLAFLALIFVFLGIALLIVLLVMLILRSMKRR
jgi:ABC-type anion transport system duplicated permease subunit